MSRDPWGNDWVRVDGRVVQGLDGRWIARISRTLLARNEPKPHPAAVQIARGWEIEGYGPDPDAALADLERKWALR